MLPLLQKLGRRVVVGLDEAAATARAQREPASLLLFLHDRAMGLR
jgi:hypothetical protein